MVIKKLSFIYRWLIYIIVALSTIVIINQRHEMSNTKDFKNPVDIRKNVSVSHNESDVKNVELPYIVNGKDTYYVDVDLKSYDTTGKAIGFSLEYSDFACYVDGKEIYNYIVNDNIPVKSGGAATYFIVDLLKSDIDKLTFKFVPKLKMSDEYYVTTMQLGNRINIVNYLLFRKNFLAIILSISLIFLGIFTVGFAIIARLDDFREKIFINVGILSILGALYSFSRYEFITYALSEHRLLLYSLEYISLMLIFCPLNRLMVYSLDNRFHRYFYIFNIILYACAILQSVITFRGVLEYHDMLKVTHIIILSNMFFILFSIVFTDEEKYVAKIWIKNLVFFLNIAMGISLFIYIFFKEYFESTTIFANMFVLFVTNISGLVLNYSNELGKITKTKTYRKMMMFDELTGLRNRYTYENYIKNENTLKKPQYITSLDMNNLKIINDTLGHKAGDKAIIACGEFLNKNLSNANVYRLGGDEFVAIDYNENTDADIERIKNKKIYVEGVSEQIEVSFSVGRCVYDTENMKSLSEAFNIADKEMYKNKKTVK